MPKISIYYDAGVSPSAFHQLLIALDEPFLSHCSFEIVDRHAFLTADWEKNTHLLIFPGGRDLPYVEALKGEANRRIRTFVEQGGRFLGLCAGGYYGSAEIDFEDGEIVGQRELSFFPGKATGPAYGKGTFQYDSEAGARAAAVMWEGGVSSVYFNGGCLFEKADSYPSIQVMARYGDLPGKPAAVVYCKRGMGAALLSGVHPEYSPHDPFWLHVINKILI